MLSRTNLHDYQERAVQYIKDKKRCLLLLDLGLGKTVSTLTAISDLQDAFEVNKVLVIAPLRVANSVWAQETQNWQHLKHLRCSIATGSEKSRIAALMKDADVYVINRENVPWLVEFYGKKWPFDFVVIDESSSFKNPSSQRFKALRRVLPDTQYLVGLTGTPSPNGLLDVWAQCYMVDFGQSLGRTMTMYKKRFFVQEGYMGYSYVPSDGADKKIQALMSDYCLSMQAEDYLELPQRIDLKVDVELKPKTKKLYDDFEKTLFSELPDGEELEAISAAVLANKLLQWANGAVYTDDCGNWSAIHDEKLDALTELVETNNEPMLVAYNYKTDLERIKSRFPDAVILDKDAETIARWNRGEIKMLLAHPASAGHGLNLQKGGSLCIWFGLNWSLELYQQFNARLYRQGQSKAVRIVHVVAKDTIDERVLTVLANKDATQKDLLQALK